MRLFVNKPRQETGIFSLITSNVFRNSCFLPPLFFRFPKNFTFYLNFYKSFQPKSRAANSPTLTKNHTLRRKLLPFKTFIQWACLLLANKFYYNFHRRKKPIKCMQYHFPSGPHVGNTIAAAGAHHSVTVSPVTIKNNPLHCLRI